MEEKKGTFTILRIHDEKLIRDKKGIKIFGVRMANFLPDGWIHRNQCTPPIELLNFCKKLEKEQKYEPTKYRKVKITKEADEYLKENPVWDEFVFKKVYLPNFIESIQHRGAKDEIKKILNELKKGNDVYYACYCGNEKICHRRIIAAIIQKQGFVVESVKK